MRLTEDKIIEILESVFKQKKGSITSRTPLENFAKDSMDVMEFIAILKNKYSVIIEPTEVAKLSTAEDVINYVLDHQASEV